MRPLTLIFLFAGIAPHLIAQPADYIDPWTEQVRTWAAEHPNSEGLYYLADALQQFDLNPLVQENGQAIRESFNEILREGWTKPHPLILEQINNQRFALASARAAAEAADIDFPPADSHSAPVPNFLKIQLMLKLMAADALRLEDAGELDRAAERAIQVIRIGDHLCAENVTLIQHLIGIAGMGIGFRGLEPILQHPDLPRDTLVRVRRELDRIDRRHTGVSAALRTEADMMIVPIRGLADSIDERLAALDPAVRDDFAASLRNRPEADLSRPNVVGTLFAGVLQGSMGNSTSGSGEVDLSGFPPIYQTYAMEAALNIETFEAEHQRVWGAMIENTERPYPEREIMNEQWIAQLTSNPMIRMTLPNFTEAATRDDVSMTHVRLGLVICDLRLQAGAASSECLDPFTMTPVCVTDEIVWSQGPDMENQWGAILYDPTNGTRSGGDIVVRR